MKQLNAGRVSDWHAHAQRRQAQRCGWISRLRIVLAAVVAGLMVTLGMAAAATPASAAGTSFTSTWDTRNTSTGSSARNQIRLPLTASGNYNFVVDWGDNSTSTITSYNQAEVTHTYLSEGIQTITIGKNTVDGVIKGWRFGNSGDKLKMTGVSAWGPLQLGNEGGYFWGATNLNLTASDGPDLALTNNLSNAFLNATSLNANLSGWDVSHVTNLNGTFRGATAFNGNVTNWDVSAVTTMNGTFRGATRFNQDISGWDVDGVTTMASMFNGAPAFDQNISSWHVDNVADMASMFNAAGVSRANYDALLIAWEARTLQPNVVFDAGSSKFTLGAASTAHAALIANDGWTISDGGVTSAPDAPTGVNATRADTGASVTWNAATENNNPVLEYVATISPAPSSGSQTCSVVPPAARSCTWTHLTNGDTYSITVTARNEVGTSVASSAATVVPQVDTPNAPVVTSVGTRPSALALDTKARITWAPGAGGGTPISYTATASPGGQTCTANAPTLTCDVLGLTNGTHYTFTVRATNPGGTSAASAVSNSVTPGPVFASQWDTTKTDGGSTRKQVRLPLVADGTYDFIVSWGDGTISNIVSSDIDPNNLLGITHGYEEEGVKDITITGTIKGWNFQNGVAGNKERLKIKDISSWGPLQLGTPTVQGEYFKGATNLTGSATDILDLTGTTSLASAFQGATSFNAPIGNWNVGSITNMSSMFAGATSFNQNLDGWRPANVTTMANMFNGASAFNKSLSIWGNLGNVTTMANMFDNADAFNSEIAWTNLGELTTTTSMFANTAAFNKGLGWPGTQAKLANTSKMFDGATAFNSSVSTLDMSDVTNASEMFQGATSFDQSVSAWDVAKVTNFSKAFKGATSFNQSVSTWNTGAVTNLTDMFLNASAFNQNLSAWNFESVSQFGQFLNNSGLANLNEASGIYNYNQFLLRLASQNVLPGVAPTIDSSPAKYSAGLAAAARTTLTGRGFTITDGGQTDLNVPDAPEHVGGDMPANPPTITWDAPNDHDSAITGYTVTAIHKTDTGTYPNVTCTSTDTSCTFATELPDASDHYKFAVTATNAVGTSEPSATDAPNVPATPTAVAGDGKATVSITAPVEGASPSSYTITSSPEGKQCTINVPATSCDVTGLTNGTPYTFTAVATNWVDSSPASDASNAVTPGKVFASSWRTNEMSTGSSEANQIKLPLPNGPTYNFYVSWGDGTTDHITSYNQAQTTHTYDLPGTKNVSITGTINGWRFADTGDKMKLLNISSWGPLKFEGNGGYFYGAANMTVSARGQAGSFCDRKPLQRVPRCF